MQKPDYRATKLGTIAKRYGLNREQLNTVLTDEHKADMEVLGWKPSKYLVIPAVHRYVVEVVIERKERLSVFPILESIEKSVKK
jgi:hypothetical protein